MLKANRADWLVFGLGISLGGWMIFDGSRKLLTGLYTGEDTVGLGPWATVVSWVGVKPRDMALPFVLLGVLWIVNAVILPLGAAGRYERTILASVLTLWYLVPGTLVSLVTLILSARKKASSARHVGILPLGVLGRQEQHVG